MSPTPGAYARLRHQLARSLRLKEIGPSEALEVLLALGHLERGGRLGLFSAEAPSWDPFEFLKSPIQDLRGRETPGSN